MAEEARAQTHIQWKIISHEKEGNPAICNNMDEPWEYHAKWDKSDRGEQTLYGIIYVWNLKMLNS